MSGYAHLAAGDPAPWFRQAAVDNPAYTFDTAAGRPIVLCFFGRLEDAHSQVALRAVLQRRDLFDDDRASFFGVTHAPEDAPPGRLRNVYPGYRFFLDLDGAVGQLYGALPLGTLTPGAPVAVRRLWVVMDAALRVSAVIPFAPDQSDIAQAIAAVEATPPPGIGPVGINAPILMLPHVFEASLCAELIARYETRGGVPSGFMRQVDGKTTMVHDASHKTRRDYLIDDPALVQETQARFRRRVAPQIERAFQFKVTRMERYIVACYDAAEEAHFKAHRDNTTAGTVHRRFAVSVNLNADFEGGEVSFPEFGRKAYKPPPGAALVFSCSLLHAVAPMRSGKRYAFLPFLYDEAAARQREANNDFLDEGVAPYQAGPISLP